MFSARRIGRRPAIRIRRATRLPPHVNALDSQCGVNARHGTGARVNRTNACQQIRITAGAVRWAVQFDLPIAQGRI